MNSFRNNHVVQGIFQRDATTGTYTGMVPQLPGCITEGSSLEEVRRFLKEAAEGYLEALTIEGSAPGALDAEITILPIALETPA